MATGARHQVAVHLLKAGYWQAGHESLMKDVAAGKNISKACLYARCFTNIA